MKSKKLTKDSKTTIRKSSLKSFEIFPNILGDLKKGSKLTYEDIENLEKLFGERVKKALEIIGEKRIMKYHFQPSGIVRWVVKGDEKNYLVIEQTFCSCKDFLFTAILKREVPSCYHLLAREVAEKIEQYQEVVVSDNEYPMLMDEWLS
ncbi:MAG: hypothetical protein ACFFDW_04035 [Candidatus Thorarchaeota archaeon]